MSELSEKSKCLDATIIWKEYLDTWPDARIMWPTGKDEQLKAFMDPGDGPALLFNQLFQFILDDKPIDPALLSCSEWIGRYSKTVAGRAWMKKNLKPHEPILAWVSFNIEPLKGLLDGFVKFYIEKVVLNGKVTP